MWPMGRFDLDTEVVSCEQADPLRNAMLYWHVMLIVPTADIKLCGQLSWQVKDVIIP